MLVPFADFIDNFALPDWLLYTGGAVFLVLIGVFFFLRNRRPADDE